MKHCTRPESDWYWARGEVSDLDSLVRGSDVAESVVRNVLDTAETHVLLKSMGKLLNTDYKAQRGRAAPVVTSSSLD